MHRTFIIQHATKMKKGLFLLILLTLFTGVLSAQETKFLKDKQGKYIANNQLNKCPGFDFAAYSGNLKVITDWFHSKNPPAFLGSKDESISGIRADGEGSPVMKFNPDCWDRNLPPTAIQFISLEYRPASEEELRQFIKRNDGLTDYVSL